MHSARGRGSVWLVVLSRAFFARRGACRELVEGIWASRALHRALCDAFIARLARASLSNGLTPGARPRPSSTLLYSLKQLNCAIPSHYFFRDFFLGAFAATIWYESRMSSCSSSHRTASSRSSITH